MKKNFHCFLSLLIIHLFLLQTLLINRVYDKKCKRTGEKRVNKHYYKKSLFDQSINETSFSVGIRLVIRITKQFKCRRDRACLLAPWLLSNDNTTQFIQY